MNEEFQVWVLLAGLAVGAALAWFAFGGGSRAPDLEAFETGDERALEAEWLARELEKQGRPVEPATLEAALALHRDLVTGRAAKRGPVAPAPPETQ
jgi:hypothetical protein